LSGRTEGPDDSRRSINVRVVSGKGHSSGGVLRPSRRVAGIHQYAIRFQPEIVVSALLRVRDIGMNNSGKLAPDA
jgi:hypothetical protein